MNCFHFHLSFNTEFHFYFWGKSHLYYGRHSGFHDSGIEHTKLRPTSSNSGSDGPREHLSTELKATLRTDQGKKLDLILNRLVGSRGGQKFSLQIKGSRHQWKSSGNQETVKSPFNSKRVSKIQSAIVNIFCERKTHFRRIQKEMHITCSCLSLGYSLIF